MLDIIANNPYRILGVFINSPKREIVANVAKIKAFSKVGRDVNFDADFVKSFGNVERDEASAITSESKLSLSQESLRYSLFWFIKLSPTDDVAFAHLNEGDIPKAVEVWKENSDLASLQNRIVCFLATNDLRNAIALSELLFRDFSVELSKSINGDTFSKEVLQQVFIDELLSSYDYNKVLPLLSGDLKEYAIGKTIKPIISEIQSRITTCDSSRGKGPKERYSAGIKLKDTTENLVNSLKSVLQKNDPQYQIIADKLGITLLQCAIDFYNDSDERDSAQKALALQKYAATIVVGESAWNRCNENIKILEENIRNLPPDSVVSEDKAIKEELAAFAKGADTIELSKKLLNNTKPFLKSIKTKLGRQNSYYLRISTLVANNALANVISEVNAAQDRIETREEYEARMNASLQGILGKYGLSDSLFGHSYTDDYLNPDRYNAWAKYHNAQVADYHKVLRNAWSVIKLIDKLDLSPDDTHYKTNRKTLKSLCDKADISTNNDRTKNILINFAIVEIILMIVATFDFVNFGSKANPAGYWENVLGLQLGWIPFGIPWCIILYFIVNAAHDKIREKWLV